MAGQHYCLRWNNYQSNMTSVFHQLLQDEAFVDVTLACNEASLKAHKVVLSACSPYFQKLLLENPCKHPVIIMPQDVCYSDLKFIIDFVYKGEVDVSQAELQSLLKTADQLKIKGLCEVSDKETAISRRAFTKLRLSPGHKRRCMEQVRRAIFMDQIEGSHDTIDLAIPLPIPIHTDEDRPKSVEKATQAVDESEFADECSPKECTPVPSTPPEEVPVPPPSMPPESNNNSNNDSSNNSSNNNDISMEVDDSPQKDPVPTENQNVQSPLKELDDAHSDTPMQERNGDMSAGSPSEKTGSDKRESSGRDSSVQVPMIPYIRTDSSNLDSRDVSDDVKVKLELRAVEHDGDIDIETNMSDRGDDEHTMMITPELLGLIPSSSAHSDGSEISQKGMKSWTPEDMEMALDALRNHSMSLTKASVTFGIPSTTLWQRAHRLGIDTPKKEGPAKTWTEDDLNSALDALRAGRISANRASKAYGIPSSTLYKIARKEGIKLSAPFNAAPTTWSSEDLNKALDAIRTGMSVQKAATEFGIPSGTLYGRCKREGIELQKNNPVPWSEDDMNEALEAVRVGEMSINQAAIHYNLPYSSLYGRFKRVKYEAADSHESLEFQVFSS